MFKDPERKRQYHQKYHKEWYERNKAKRQQQIKARNRRVKAENKAKVRAYLAAHPCVDCGESDPIVLEFDHVRGTKRAAVGRLAADHHEWSTIEAEIAKCVVRCANCHRRVTHQRRQQSD